ncbi:uncharacterized protein LOC110428853, partial [Herrania umbratica]|uniref:Uncharacterized protein LOC110428853 n=1 Tax=Herrania umbratica TaxID=108875 RepID=A0A6J1BMB9_9ROSI
MEADSTGGPPPDVDEGETAAHTGVGVKRFRSREEKDSPHKLNEEIIENRSSHQEELSRFSYRHVLMHGDIEMQSEDAESNEGGERSEDYESEDDAMENKVDGPYIWLTKEDKRRIRQPWKNTLIVKLLGRDISYTYLCNRVRQLWSVVGDFQAINLNNGFYCFKFSKKSDYSHVLLDGPWIILGHYLTIRRWSPNFRSEDASIESVAAWVRLPRRPLEFYDREILSRIGDELGRTVKVDRTTSTVSRGKFARLCVELDLNKPLVAKVFIAKQREQESHIVEEAMNITKKNVIHEKDYDSARYGPWMVAKRYTRRNT